MHPIDIVISFTNLEGNEQPTTPITENTPQNKSYDKNRQFSFLVCFFFLGQNLYVWKKK